MATRNNSFCLAAVCLALCGLLGAGACGGDGESTPDDPPDENEPVSPLEKGAFRAAVIDSLTGRAILDAKVVVSVAGQSGSWDMDLKSNGRYQTSGIGDSDSVTVSVFHKDYNYVTVSGLKSHDVVIPLRRLIPARRGGLTGTLTTWPAQGDSSTLAVGVAALSLQGNILDFDRKSFLGDEVQTNFVFPSWLSSVVKAVAPTSPDEYPVAVPGSVLLGNKTDFSVLGLPSPCGDAALERSGSCGTQAAFSAYASVSGFTDPIVSELYGEDGQELVSEMVDIIDNGADFNLRTMLPKALPLLPKLLRHVSMDFASGIELSFGDGSEELFVRDFYPNHPMDQSFSLTVPQTPQLMERAHADLVGAIALADLGTEGLIPLGLGAASTDGSPVTIDLTMADGGIALQGTQKRILAFALDSDISQAAGNKSLIPVFSAILQPLEGGLPSGGSASISGTFLRSPTESGFIAAARTLYNLPDISGASLYRAEIKGDGRQWVTYFGPGTVSLRLPSVPEGYPDVIDPDDDGHTLLAISLRDGMTFDQLFGDSEFNENSLNDVMSGFSYAVHYADAEDESEE